VELAGRCEGKHSAGAVESCLLPQRGLKGHVLSPPEALPTSFPTWTSSQEDARVMGSKAEAGLLDGETGWVVEWDGKGRRAGGRPGWGRCPDRIH